MNKSQFNQKAKEFENFASYFVPELKVIWKEEIPSEEGMTVAGLFHTEKNEIWLNKKEVREKDEDSLLRIFLHELYHSIIALKSLKEIKEIREVSKKTSQRYECWAKDEATRQVIGEKRADSFSEETFATMLKNKNFVARMMSQKRKSSNN